jgi:ABC-type polysaccharide/polyol phosphate export permease
MSSISLDIPAEPPAELRFRRKVRLGESLRELWRARELIRTLAERDLRARYKQAILGFAWAIIPPVGLMIVFTVFVKHIGNVSTEGAPYQLYAYLGLIPWTFFSSAVSTGGQSLLANVSLLNKVYCPREVFPLSQLIVAGVDALTSTLVLVVLFPINHTYPRFSSVWVPVLLVVLAAFTVGIVMLISSVIVYVRDVRHALPIILQFGLFATPVAYSLHAIPARARAIYSVLDPLAPVIDGLRRSLLLDKGPDLRLLALGAASSAAMLVIGFSVFKRLETGVADVA